MKKFTFLLLVMLSASMFAQFPNSFKYQVVVRGASGDVLPTQAVSFRMNILQGTTTVYTETFNETTNDFGLVSLNIGTGTTTDDFSLIDWKTGDYSLKVELDEVGGTNYSEMGISILVAVPFAMYSKDVQTKQILNFQNDTLYLTDGGQVYMGNYAGMWQQNDSNIYYNDGWVGVGTSTPSGMMVIQGDEGVDPDTALFEVKNKEGQTIFAVYDGGVRIWVDDTGAKSNTDKGGFAVGGYRINKSITNEYLRVTPDSVRIYIKEDDGLKSNTDKGGFAVGGYRMNKSLTSDFFNIGASDSTETINPSEPRVMWYPFKEAFLAGKVLIEHQDSVGFNSFSAGFECKAKGDYSQAFGYQSRAAGYNSTAIGNKVNAEGTNSMAFGDSSIANGYASYAFGTCGFDTLTGLPTEFRTEANGDYSMAFGFGTVADSIGTIALGSNSAALGSFSFVAGLLDTAYAPFSVAMGVGSVTKGEYSCAIGLDNLSSGNGAYAIGAKNVSSGQGSFAFGYLSESTGLGSYTIGAGDTATASGSVVIGVASKATADVAFAFGYKSVASGVGSFAIGSQDTALIAGAFAIGTNADATGILSMALGTNTRASNTYATAMGNATLASGINSTAMGFTTIASGNYSTAFGNTTVADGLNSTVFGNNMIVNGDYSFGINLSTTVSTITNNNTMAIMGGYVGIGANSPARRLHVIGSNEAAARFVLNTTPGTGGGGTLIEFYSKTSFFGIPLLTGSITVSNTGTLTYGTFTGSHLVNISEDTKEGILISLTGDNSYIDNANKTGEIIYGGQVSQEENSANIIGSYFGEQEISENRKSDLVMAVGNGSMWVVDNGEDLQIGDYLISSAIKGHATKDIGKYEVANIVARVAEPVNWNNETKTINGVKHKLVSVFFESFKLYHNEKKINDLEYRIEQLEKLIEISDNK